jgi:ribose transport system permease protein
LSAGVIPVLLIALIVFFGIVEPRFLSGSNMFNVLRQSSYLIIVAMGQGAVLISGGFDLSVGAVVGLVSVTSALTMTSMAASSGSWTAIILGAAVGLAVGALVGLINGMGVHLFRVSPFIVTVGTMSVATGVALLQTGGAPVTGLPSEFVEVLGTGRWLGVPASLWVTAVIVGLTYILFSWTRVGRSIYAIGGNERAARLSGIRVGRYVVGVYLLSGVLAALSGILLTARVSSGEPNLGGPFLLQSIAAAVLGGITLRGGEGSIMGAVVGSFFIAFLSNGMNLIRVQSYFQMIVLGVLLVLAAGIDRLRYARRLAA